jgi:transcriptional regulator with XRE-family HTH domain
MEARDKKYIQFKYAVCINKIIASNRVKAKENKSNKTKDHKLINSLRKLEAASGISFPIIQNISIGNKNPALTTVVALSEALEISLGEFFSYFDSITEEDVAMAMAKKKKRKK